MLFKEIVSNCIKNKKPATVLLCGDMGAGKTTFVKDVLKDILPEVNVTSPTFAIINTYADNVYHADLYRIKDVSELENIDFYGILGGDNVFFIEWPFNNVPEDIYKSLPNVTNVNILVGENERRKITFN